MVNCWWINMMDLCYRVTFWLMSTSLILVYYIIIYIYIICMFLVGMSTSLIHFTSSIFSINILMEIDLQFFRIPPMHLSRGSHRSRSNGIPALQRWPIPLWTLKNGEDVASRAGQSSINNRTYGEIMRKYGTSPVDRGFNGETIHKWCIFHCHV